MEQGGELQTTVAFGSSSTAAAGRAPPSVSLTSAPPFVLSAAPKRPARFGGTPSPEREADARTPDQGASTGSLFGAGARSCR